MSSPQAERILDLGRQLRGELSTVIDAPAPSFAARFDVLLARAAGGFDVTADLIELLSSEPATRRWMDEHLSRPRLFEPPPGSGPAIPPGGSYTCPQCGVVWRRRSAGQKVPACPNDGSALQAAVSRC